MNGVVKNITALSIETTSQLTVLTNAQKILLKCIRDCVKNQMPMNWDLIVLVYTEGVRKIYRDYWRVRYGTEDKAREYSILEEYQNCTGQWTYTIRPIVRQWFLTNIGILVLKNQLVIIPTIDLDDKI